MVSRTRGRRHHAPPAEHLLLTAAMTAGNDPLVSPLSAGSSFREERNLSDCSMWYALYCSVQ